MALRRPRRHVETAREVIDAIYRHGLVWAAATAVLVALIALVWRGGSGVLGAAVGGGVAVAFLAAGRAVPPSTAKISKGIVLSENSS